MQRNLFHVLLLNYLPLRQYIDFYFKDSMYVHEDSSFHKLVFFFLSLNELPSKEVILRSDFEDSLGIFVLNKSLWFKKKEP